ncbi:VQ motif-containing protein [Forsythia ovata]|uniref:VQ motif-containing protein n=1 Tax=Forsythia ovata TaxID=205694 RepID=A0ABD1RRG7_9LAMI
MDPSESSSATGNNNSAPPVAPQPPQRVEGRKPVITYLRSSPRVIHVQPGDFKELVQKLTGNPATVSASLAATTANAVTLYQFPIPEPILTTSTTISIPATMPSASSKSGATPSKHPSSR